ncbi:TnsD family Tn7-like transposition protein [Gilvimarinus xylanilyticus]
MKIPYRHRIQPDETVSSFVARALRLSASPSRPSALAEVLGGARVRLHPYMTAHLKTIGRQLDVSAEELLSRHTLYPLFKWFGFDKYRRLKKAMLSGHGGCAVIASGLPHSKLHFYEGLKVCPVCVREDRARLGYAYYKLSHQIPGIGACHEHACRLIGVSGGDFGYDRYISMPPIEMEPELCSPIETRLALFSHNALELAKSSPQPIDYHRIYHDFLRGKGLRTRAGHVRLRKLVCQIINAYEDYDFSDSLGMPETLGTFKFIGPLLRRKTHYRCHPAKHLLLAFWLLDGEANHYLAKIPKEKGRHLDISKERYGQEQLVLEFLEDGCSMRKIESTVGRSRSYIRHVAEIHGIPHGTNSMVYPEEIRRKVIALATIGMHRKTISSKTGVGVGYVEMVISNTPGLSQLRRDLRHQKKIEAAVEELTKIRSKHPGWLRKDIKSHCAASYFAIYNEDKELLETLLPPKTKPLPPGKNWQKEDARLSKALRALDLKPKTSLSEIDHLIVGHGFLLKHLNNLPLTASTLREMGVL